MAKYSYKDGAIYKYETYYENTHKINKKRNFTLNLSIIYDNDNKEIETCNKKQKQNVF